eukprot:TRINITY_DN5677_c1_g1_i2.p1 TRINITY_DN5677_c1_g1~~TRINITY_DN5677_c1_g1_i2.p1  ORF type:complete len:196 (+),score=27.76 TRINITY_DN5677_c1_g1_i2:496-1083(+)
MFALFILRGIAPALLCLKVVDPSCSRSTLLGARIESPSPPKIGVTDDKDLRRHLTKGLLGEGEFSSRQNEGSSGESEDSEAHWLPRRVVHCGKAIGVTMEVSKGGWASLMEFAQNREKQNQAEKGKRKFKRKGERDLNSLCCYFDYDKARNQEVEGHVSSKSEEKSGGFHVLNEGSLMECSGSWGEPLEGWWSKR